MLLTHSFQIWGVSGTLTVEEPRHLDVAISTLESWVARMDSAVNRFLPDSELSRLNRLSDEWFDVTPDFLLALEAALLSSEITEGLCDPTVLTALEAWGYDQDFSAVASSVVTPTPSTRAPGIGAIEIDRSGMRVRLAPGTKVDFGASAKALTADLVADDAAREGGVCVEIGGDVAVRPRRDGQPWVIGVSDSLRVTSSTPRIGVVAGGVATSSRVVRAWQTSRGPAHHIIDPRTGQPANTPVVSASVSAASCVLANAFATASLLWGREAGYHIAQAGWSARVGYDDHTFDYINGWPTPKEIS